MTIQMNKTGNKLVFFGALLFLLGLFEGGLIPYFTNARMALSAHLAAVQNGMALMLFGLFWSQLVLAPKWLKTAYYSSVLGMYLVWFGITLAAIFGASKVLPMASAGFSATPLQEVIVEVIETAGVSFDLLAMVLIVLGLYKGLSQRNA